MKTQPKKLQVLIFEIIPKAKCEVKARNGEHCPETPILRNEGLLLCDKCYERWQFFHTPKPQKKTTLRIY